MDRRLFLKLSTLTGLAAFAPMDLIVDNKDDETKAMEYILTHYDDELAVLDMIQRYTYVSCFSDNANYHRGITNFTKEFIERQPNIMFFLRSRIQISASSPNGLITTNHTRYNHHRKNFVSADWCKYIDNEWNKIGKKFNLPTYEPRKIA